MTRIIMFLLLAAVLIYLAVYAVNALSNPFTTVTAMQFTVEDSISMVGYIVRSEEVVESGAEYVDARVREGERVGLGQIIARTYGDSAALQRQRRIDELELSISQLDLIFISESDPAVATKLDSEIMGLIISLSASAAKGELTGAEDSVLSLKSLILSRSEIYSGSGDIAALKSALQSELDILKSESGASFVIYSEHTGVFSLQPDGYESLITPEMLDSFTSADFDALEKVKPSASDTAFGKYIFGIKWYFVALINEEDAEIIGGSKAVNMRFFGGYTNGLTMTVERISAPDNSGRCVLVLSSNRSLSETSTLRRQTIDIINRQYSGIRVPKSALRVSENGAAGVYCVSGLQSKFKEVTILYELDNYFIVEQESGRVNALHVGDEIIVNAKDLYDGKVISR